MVNKKTLDCAFGYTLNEKLPVEFAFNVLITHLVDSHIHSGVLFDVCGHA